MKAFLCHNSKDSKFVIEIASYLKQNLNEVFYFEDYKNNPNNISFKDTINEKIDRSEIFIAFIGDIISDYQKEEIKMVSGFQKSESKYIIPVNITNKVFPKIDFLNDYNFIEYNQSAYEIAKKIITEKLNLTWKSKDGLPTVRYQYEKDIINDYIQILNFGEKLYKDEEKNEEKENIRSILRDKILLGLPPIWPDVKIISNITKSHDIPESITGHHRSKDAKVIAAALTNLHDEKNGMCFLKNNLTFPEAGPRESLLFPRKSSPLKVAILVSGGIAPGINSVIDGITRRHELYSNGNPEKPEHTRNKYSVKIYGLLNGFYAFDDFSNNHIILTSEITSKHASEGGSFIGTARDERLFETDPEIDQNDIIARKLLDEKIEILYIIGGDGSMKSAHVLWNYSKELIKSEPKYRNHKLSVIGIPKTMDNDILWVWQTFGFLSAVEKAREIIEQLSTEIISNPRICIVQLFGSDSGFVVSQAVVASKSNICDAALIPEVPFTMEKLAEYLKEKIEKDTGRSISKIPMSMIVMAETAIPQDALKYIDDESFEINLSEEEKKAIRGFLNKEPVVNNQKRNDHLRNAGLKIVSKVLPKLLQIQKEEEDNTNIKWEKLRVFTNEPRHLLRTINPSCLDTITGNRLGTLAVDNALAGYSDFMISQWLTEFVLVPLKLVVLGKKRIPTRGMFWKSVIAKTGQPFDMETTDKKKSEASAEILIS